MKENANQLGKFSLEAGIKNLETQLASISEELTRTEATLSQLRRQMEIGITQMAEIKNYLLIEKLFLQKWPDAGQRPCDAYEDLPVASQYPIEDSPENTSDTWQAVFPPSTEQFDAHAVEQPEFSDEAQTEDKPKNPMYNRNAAKEQSTCAHSSQRNSYNLFSVINELEQISETMKDPPTGDRIKERFLYILSQRITEIRRYVYTHATKSNDQLQLEYLCTQQKTSFIKDEEQLWQILPKGKDDVYYETYCDILSAMRYELINPAQGTEFDPRYYEKLPDSVDNKPSLGSTVQSVSQLGLIDINGNLVRKAKVVVT